MNNLKQKRQYFHQLLLKLGEVQYKDVIVEAACGVASTSEITDERQLDKLITDAENRIKQRNLKRPNTSEIVEKQIRNWRNRCLQVLSERGINATARDWQQVNEELAKKHYQWLMPVGQTNQRGLYAFNNTDDLKKLFKQLCIIRDNERAKQAQLLNLATKN